MSQVRMYIDKFKKEVLIEEDHPLAIAQRETPKSDLRTVSARVAPKSFSAASKTKEPFSSEKFDA